MNNKVSKALNISQPWGEQSMFVFTELRSDFMKPVVTGVETLLNDTDIIVAVYNGQYDLIVDIDGKYRFSELLCFQ